MIEATFAQCQCRKKWVRRALEGGNRLWFYALLHKRRKDLLSKNDQSNVIGVLPLYSLYTVRVANHQVKGMSYYVGGW